MDSRAYFDYAGSSVSTGEVNAAELIQGYVGVAFDDALGSGSSTSVDVGRFTMDLGDRKSVVSGTSVSVRVEIGGRRTIKNTKITTTHRQHRRSQLDKNPYITVELKQQT